MIVYFAEPIDQDNSSFIETEFRKSMVDILVARGHGVYRPATAWLMSKVDRTNSVRVERTNREALRNADLLVARLPEGVASVGVPMEIEYATRTLGIQAVVCGYAGVALLGNPNVRMAGGGRTLDEFRKAIDDLGVEQSTQNELRHVGALTPRSYPGDAGIDLVASADTIIPAGGTARVPTGNHFAFPKGVWGWIMSRSSTFENFGLQILPGIIDEGYTGELFANALNPSNEPILVPAGSRICQIILFDNVTARYQPVQVDQIAERDRGSNGFGSTGANGHFLNNGPDELLLRNP